MGLCFPLANELFECLEDDSPFEEGVLESIVIVLAELFFTIC
jgi:hypothetical protein